MGIARILGKIVAAPIRVADIPFRVMRELMDDPDPEQGALADVAKAVEKGVEGALEDK